MSRSSSSMSFGELIGVEVVSDAPGEVVCRLEIGTQHLNQALICQGGAMFTLADVAVGLLLNREDDPTTWVSTSFDLQLFRAAGVDDVVTARAVFEHESRSLRSCRVTLRRQPEDLVGVLTNQAIRLPPRESGIVDPARLSVVRAASDPLGRAMVAARRRKFGRATETGRVSVIVTLDDVPVASALLDLDPPHAARDVWVAAHHRDTALESACAAAVARAGLPPSAE